MRYTQNDIAAVDSVSLEDIMGMHSRKPSLSTKSILKYACPFHRDEDPSFVVEKTVSLHAGSGKPYKTAAWRCCGCGCSGYGAISLYSRLSGLTRPEDMSEVVRQISARENIVLPDGGYANDAWSNRRSNDVDPSEEIRYDYGEWTEKALAALGCRTIQKMAPSWTEGEKSLVAVMDKDGNALTCTEWDQTAEDGSTVRLDTASLERLFHVRPVESYVTEAAEIEVPGSGKEMRSYRYEFSDGYPVFEFRFTDGKGWISKKYEPMFRPHLRPDGKPAANYKFTWWMSGGRKKTARRDLSSRLYGDDDVMRTLEGATPETSCPLHPLEVSTWTGPDGEEQTSCRFRRVVICSGPRDAMQVWYHSDAHVIYPHSENTEIGETQMRRIRRIASEIYVLYDTDQTGTTRAEQLCMRYTDVRLVRLPSAEMAQVRSMRSGKPCKDASEYFEMWDSIRRMFPHPSDYARTSSAQDFRQRLKTARSMQFIEAEKHIRPKTKEEFYKYTIDVESAIQLLAARGLKKAPKGSSSSFVLVSHNIVESISEKQVVSLARQMLTQFLSSREEYTQGMGGAIATSNRLTLELMKLLPEAELNYRSCGEDYDYFFFRNGALRITPDEIRLDPYSSLGFVVEKDAILDVDYQPWKGSWPIQITENPDLAAHRLEYSSRLSGMSPAEKRKATRRLTEWERLHRFRMKLALPMEEMPEAFQFLYDTSRIKWFKENAGISLTDDDLQFQTAHLVNKMAALGYYLYRFRTDASQQMVVAVDYFRQQSDLDSGRSGKTTMRTMVEFVRRQLHVAGKDFKTGQENFAKNFSKFRLNVHSGIFVDDVRSDISSESFYNITQELSVKSVYEDQYILRPEETPKLFLTQNRKFNLQSSSTLGRIYPMFFSDYYHQNSISGDTLEMSPLKKFGHLILENPDDETFKDIASRDRKRAERIRSERCFVQNFLARCLQFYLQRKEVILPPLDEDSDTDKYLLNVDSTFIEWADIFFRRPEHFGVLIPVQEMIYSYLSFKGNPDGKAGRAKMTENMELRIRENRKEFRGMLIAYCQMHHISNTPPHLIRSKQDRERGAPRYKHWVTRFDIHGREQLPRRFTFDSSSVVPCRIFFQSGTDPYTDISEIPPVPDMEPAQDWLMVELD